MNYDWCIRCYRCAEQCPHEAIRLHGGVLNHTTRPVRKVKKI
ncbi:MAG: 4Fe-4S binding protein [Chitinispirillaceae bacterium]|nr:4Fe-4S binding protein [Chitinispirillaceae bacterium]